MTNSSPSQSDVERPTIPERAPARGRLFKTAAVLAPLVLLVVLEFALRLAGRGGYPSAVLRVGKTGAATLCLTNGAYPRTYFGGPSANAGSLTETAFLDPKPPGTVRVVLAGESAAKGFPQPAGLSAAAFLEDMLGNVWPDRRVEVIDIGVTGVASYPVEQLVEAILPYEPDLVVLYVGHNEFYGACGVASALSRGRSPAAIHARRWLGSLAVVQALTRPRMTSEPAAGGHLMERAAAAEVPPDDPLRRQAADNLAAYVRATLAGCRRAGIPAMVCTLACNERDLAPIGGSAGSTVGTDTSEDKLRDLLRSTPQLALLHYQLGRACFNRGAFPEAQAEFQQAIDLDTMPWRATSRQNAALRDAAGSEGATVCDVVDYFRRPSPGGCIGNELFDDHVHFTLGGQWLFARALVDAMVGLDGACRVPADAVGRLASFQEAAAQLGANGYEAFGVAHQMAILFDIPFLQQSNPQQLDRFRQIRDKALASMPQDLQKIAEDWAKPLAEGELRRSLSAQVAGRLGAHGRIDEALPLWRVAMRSDPPLSAWYFEDVLGLLLCRKLAGNGLAEEDRALARDTLARIRLLGGIRPEGAGEAAFWMGRFHHLLDEYGPAIEELETARKHVEGIERLQSDQTLVDCYVRLHDRAAALRIIEEGMAGGGPSASYYETLRRGLPPAD